MISSGRDGDAMLGWDELGRGFELRVLNSKSLARVAEVRRQLELLQIADHACIRSLSKPLCENCPPTFALTVPLGVDPFGDRLSEITEHLEPAFRFRIAASIVDACQYAHRIGLCHGSFAASNILISPDRTSGEVYIDYSGMVCSDDVDTIELSVDGDLERLHGLLGKLLSPVLDLSEADGIELLSGRGRDAASLDQKTRWY